MDDANEKFRELKRAQDSDNIRIKEIIKRRLLKNQNIIYALNNKEFIGRNAALDEYFGVNIFPYFYIADIQTKVRNFLCFETSTNELSSKNNIIKIQQVNFRLICHINDIIDIHTGLCRHDLLAAVVTEEFNHKNYFGTKLRCVSDTADIFGKEYIMRTLKFEMQTANNIIKTENKKVNVINYE